MNHEHEGQGGSYIIDENGERKLVERTKEAPDSDPPAPAEAATHDEPATAGFFSPVDPADQPTAE